MDFFSFKEQKVTIEDASFLTEADFRLLCPVVGHRIKLQQKLQDYVHHNLSDISTPRVQIATNKNADLIKGVDCKIYVCVILPRILL